MTHWYITYRWKRRADRNWVFSDCVHAGTIASWVLEAIEQEKSNETWFMISAVEISKEEYGQLDGVVG